MKLIELTRGYYAKVDNDDFEELNKFSWRVIPVRDKFYYAARRSLVAEGTGRKNVFMHRQITKAPKGMDVDHINHDTLDNRKSNLRVCTRSQNQQNSVVSRGLSKFKGVSWRPDRKHWRVVVRINGKKKYFGSFHNEVEAALAYDRAAILNFGEFALLNFPLALGSDLVTIERVSADNPK